MILPRFKHGSFSQNFAIKLTAAVVGGGLQFAFFLWLMNALGPASFGTLSLALSWGFILSAALDFGLNPIVTRDLSVHPEAGPAYFRLTLQIRAFLVGVALVALLVASVVSPQLTEMRLLLFAAFFWVSSTVGMEMLQAFAYAYNKYLFGAIWSTLQRACIAAFGMTAFAAGGHVLSIAGAAALGATGILVVAGCLSCRWLASHGGGGMPLSRRRLLSEAFPILLSGVLAAVYFRMSVIMLGHLTDARETGLFSAAYRFFEVSNVIPGAFVAAAQPALARALQAGQFKNKALNYLGWMLAVAVCAAGGLFLLSYALPYVVDASRYERSAGLMRWLSLAIIPLYCNYMLLTALTVKGRQRMAAWSSGIVLLFNAGLNSMLIPNAGSVGAAWTTIASECLLSVLCLSLLRGPALAGPDPAAGTQTKSR